MGIFANVNGKKDVSDIFAPIIGKNLLKNTAVSTTVKDVTFTVNEDGSITANGTASAVTTSGITINELYLEQGDEYIISGGISSDKRVCIYYQPDYKQLNVFSSGSDTRFTVPISGKYRVYPWIQEGVTCDNDTFYPMLRLASIEDNTYEPYIGVRRIKSVWASKNGVPIKVFNSVMKPRFVVISGGTGLKSAYCLKDSETWNIMPNFDTSMRGLTYGNGRFVAVGTNGYSYHSIDGETWVEGESSGDSADSLIAVTYGNGKFVAIGGQEEKYYSLDGITWIKTDEASDVTTNSSADVTYGNGRFVCVTSQGNSYYSLDGETWTKMSGANVTLYGVTYGNGRFVCVGKAGKAFYSTDGETWIAMSGLNTGVLYWDVTYGGGIFVCVGKYRSIFYSTDGETWIEAEYNSSHSDAYNAVTYANEKFVVAGYDGTVETYSYLYGMLLGEGSMEDGLFSNDIDLICYSIDGGYDNS